MQLVNALLHFIVDNNADDPNLEIYICSTCLIEFQFEQMCKSPLAFVFRGHIYVIGIKTTCSIDTFFKQRECRHFVRKHWLIIKVFP